MLGNDCWRIRPLAGDWGGKNWIRSFCDFMQGPDPSVQMRGDKGLLKSFLKWENIWTNTP